MIMIVKKNNAIYNANTILKSQVVNNDCEKIFIPSYIAYQIIPKLLHGTGQTYIFPFFLKISINLCPFSCYFFKKINSNFTGLGDSCCKCIIICK